MASDLIFLCCDSLEFWKGVILYFVNSEMLCTSLSIFTYDIRCSIFVVVLEMEVVQDSPFLFLFSLRRNDLQYLNLKNRYKSFSIFLLLTNILS